MRPPSFLLLTDENRGLWQDLVRPFRQSIAYSKAGKVSLGHHWKRSPHVEKHGPSRILCLWVRQNSISLKFMVKKFSSRKSLLLVTSGSLKIFAYPEIAKAYAVHLTLFAPGEHHHNLRSRMEGFEWKNLCRKWQIVMGCCELDKTSRRFRRQLENLWSVPRPSGEGGRLQSRPKARHARGQLWCSQLMEASSEG